MATQPVMERDPLFDVIALEDGDSRFRVFVPEEPALSGAEFAIVRETHTLIQDYFGKPISQVKTPKNFDTELCGRAVKLYGITGDEAFEEFRKAFRIEDKDLIVPVVKNTELAVVIDKYIVSQLRTIFYQSCPRIPQGYVRPQKPTSDMTEEELELLELEETAQTIERLKKQCFPLMDPVLKPGALLAVLEEIPINLIGSFMIVIHILRQRMDIFRTLVVSSKIIDNISAYTGLDTVQFVLGEEMLKRVKKVLPITWKLPRDQVQRVHFFVECKVRELSERVPIGSERAPSQEESELAEEIRAPFAQFLFVRDYYLDPEFLPVLLNLVHTPLRPFPRLEIVRQAFKNYIAVEKLIYYSTSKLFRLLAWAKRNKSDMREQIVRELELTSSWVEVTHVLQQFGFPNEQYTEQEREIFVFFFTTLLSEENEFLLSEVPPFLEDEVEDVLDLIIDAVILGEEEVCVLLEEPNAWDHLREIESQAKRTLDRACADVKIRMVYSPLWGGRKAEVGSLNMDSEALERYYAQVMPGESEDLGDFVEI